MQDTVVLGGDWESDLVIDGECDLSLAQDGAAGIVTVISDKYPEYAGPVSVTPSEEVQTLEVSGRVVMQNIVVDAIPSNYGRVSWNGSHLMIS